MRVVLADDALILREGLSRLLTEAGFEVGELVGRRRQGATRSSASPNANAKSSR